LLQILEISIAGQLASLSFGPQLPLQILAAGSWQPPFDRRHFFQDLQRLPPAAFPDLLQVIEISITDQRSKLDFEPSRALFLKSMSRYLSCYDR